MSLEDYEVRHVEDHERPAVMDFMIERFLPREYLLSTYFAKNKYRISEDELRVMKDDFRRMFEDMAMKQPCFFALHIESQEIAGFLMTAIEENPKLAVNGANNSKPHGHGVQMKSKLMSDWFTHVLDATYANFDFFQEYPKLRTAMDFALIGVDSSHGGRGIATALTRLAIDYARSKKIDVVHGIFTSPYSCRAAEKAGFTTYKEVDIMSFRDDEGNVIYSGTKPHVTYVMAYLCSDE